MNILSVASGQQMEVIGGEAEVTAAAAANGGKKAAREHFRQSSVT